MKRMETRKTASAAFFVAISLVAYLRWIRPWQQRWGATDDELARQMPGDDIVKSATFNATRSVTVEATPEHIWPWLVQGA